MKNTQACFLEIRKKYKISVFIHIRENLNVYISRKKTEVYIFTQTKKKNQIPSKVDSSQISNGM